jgi:predicted RecA/RadA family phage recombinase
MKNFIQKGDTITLTAPTGGVSSGGGVLVGSLFGIAAGDAAENADVEVLTRGVFELPKATGAIAQGAKVYWNNANGNVTTTVTGNTLIGAAIAAAASGDATVIVRLNGTV